MAYPLTMPVLQANAAEVQADLDHILAHCPQTLADLRATPLDAATKAQIAEYQGGKAAFEAARDLLNGDELYAIATALRDRQRAAERAGRKQTDPLDQAYQRALIATFRTLYDLIAPMATVRAGGAQ